MWLSLSTILCMCQPHLQVFSRSRVTIDILWSLHNYSLGTNHFSSTIQPYHCFICAQLSEHLSCTGLCMTLQTASIHHWLLECNKKNQLPGSSRYAVFCFPSRFWATVGGIYQTGLCMSLQTASNSSRTTVSINYLAGSRALFVRWRPAAALPPSSCCTPTVRWQENSKQAREQIHFGSGEESLTVRDTRGLASLLVKCVFSGLRNRVGRSLTWQLL